MTTKRNSAPTFKRTFSATPVYSATQLLADGVGHCAVIVVTCVSTELVQRLLNGMKSEELAGVKVICGVLIVLDGGWWIYTEPRRKEV